MSHNSSCNMELPTDPKQKVFISMIKGLRKCPLTYAITGDDSNDDNNDGDDRCLENNNANKEIEGETEHDATHNTYAEGHEHQDQSLEHDADAIFKDLSLGSQNTDAEGHGHQDQSLESLEHDADAIFKYLSLGSQPPFISECDKNVAFNINELLIDNEAPSQIPDDASISFASQLTTSSPVASELTSSSPVLQALVLTKRKWHCVSLKSGSLQCDINQKHGVSVGSQVFSIEESDDEEVATDELHREEPFALPQITTDEQLAAAFKAAQRIVSNPLETIPKPNNVPTEDLPEEVDIGLVPRKRKRLDPRAGVLITRTSVIPLVQDEPSPMVVDTESPIAEDVPVILAEKDQSPPAEDVQDVLAENVRSPEELMFDDLDEEEIVFDMGTQNVVGSSSQAAPESSTSVHEKVAEILSMQTTNFQSKGKGIELDSEPVNVRDLQYRVFELEQECVAKDVLIGELDGRVSELEKSNAAKDEKIDELYTLFYDMKRRLTRKFGKRFKDSSNDDNDTPEDAGSAPGPTSRSTTSGAGPVSQSTHVPAPDVNIDDFLASGLSDASERREKGKRVEKKKLIKKTKGLLIRKNSDQHAISCDAPAMFITNLEKKKFGSRYGDRSGILMWGYETDQEMWIVRRRSGNIEYYKDEIDFNSWTAVDLSELVHAPFNNPSNVQKAWNFKLFLENQQKVKFSGMKTAKSFTRTRKDVIDPRTNKEMKFVRWPATKQVRKIPVPPRMLEGYLDDMEFWMFDDTTSTVVIRAGQKTVQISDPKNLLKFGEKDIRTLAQHQIITEEEVNEYVAKEYTRMVALIIEKKLWAGALDGVEAHLIVKDA